VSEQPGVVFHMLPKSTWEALPPGSDYCADTLATEGFVHCTAEPDMLEVVANRFYRAQQGAWLILAVDLEQVEAEVRWEAADGHLFPHIYGPIARRAVTRVVPFPRRQDGTYYLREGSL
jgi:uncharacterized protein (DUF952 family)